MAVNVFAYGSLVAPDVMQVVTGRAHEHVRARLPAFARYVLVGRVYPGIVPEPESAIDGRLYFGVSEAELRRLDWWEDEEYDRERVEVEVVAGERVAAWTYVVAPEHRSLLGDTAWSEERFIEEDLSDFLAHTRIVMRDYTDETR
ncbi:MAG: gamma-glutamylcyclotransferase family protein [Myxococcota bacterium]|jgi:gamma-glutamylcyclotransferase (GGCT)/AIG2-like uncharacterized protein YtfP|nr:gamma-glutamylcyclotransferase family protein [Myxococcota bacterium]